MTKKLTQDFEESLQLMTLQEKEQLFMESKELYYIDGESTLSDPEFDLLEEDLRNEGSALVNIVDTDVKFTGKLNHPSAMLSLTKVQADNVGNIPNIEVQKWMSETPTGTEYIAELKYDGSAGNIIYLYGKLDKVLSRTGKVITKKFKGLVPDKIATQAPLLEVRVEILFPTEEFDRNYSKFVNPDNKYSNARNFIAGVMNRDDYDPVVMKHVKIMPHEIRIHKTDGTWEYPSDTRQMLIDFKFDLTDSVYLKFKGKDFPEIYEKIKKYREEESPYLLDGMVIKTEEANRKKLGDTGHHPNWALAVKFPPIMNVAIVKAIRWSGGKTGELFPVAILEPTELDGTIVQKASAYNWGYLVKNGIFPGAKVTIAKAGDIIPEIQDVKLGVFPKDVSQFLPNACIKECMLPCKDFKARVDGIHVYCANKTCSAMEYRRFGTSIGALKLAEIGSSTRTKLFLAGITKVEDFWSDKFDKQRLIHLGAFSAGKKIDIIFKQIHGMKKIPLHKVIYALQFNGIGETASKQIAKKYNGIPYDFKGLTGVDIDPFKDEQSTEWQRIVNFVKVLENAGVKIEGERKGIIVEMTGSPKGISPFVSKEDLEEAMAPFGYVSGGIKNAKYLLTDSHASTSGKMSAARKGNVEILTYQEFCDKIGITGGSKQTAKTPIKTKTTLF